MPRSRLVAGGKKRQVAKKLMDRERRMRKCINREPFPMYLDHISIHPSIHQPSSNYVLFAPAVLSASALSLLVFG